MGKLALVNLLIVPFSLSAQDAPKKADARTLAADKCHYIIQGARIDQLRSLNQQGRCVAWESYAKPADHLAALRLYRAEVEKAWPGNMKRWDLVRDLAIIDAEK